MNNSQNTRKMTVRLSVLTDYRLGRDFQRAGCRSKNEFIEKAAVRYLDALEAEQNEALPVAIQSAIDGRLGMFEDRLSKLMFKQSVEIDMGLSALLDYLKIDPNYLRKLRVESVQNVKATNGRLTFEQEVRAQEDGGDSDPWQD